MADDILISAERLKRALEQGGDYEQAVSELDSAASGPPRVSGFRPGPTGAERSAAEDPDEIFRSIVLDLHEGNVLMAASVAVPADPKAAPSAEAVNELGTAISDLRSASAAVQGTATHGFLRRPAQKPPALPDQPDKASEMFVTEGQATLDGFQADAGKALGDAIQRLWNLKDEKQVQAAFDHLPEPVGELAASALDEKGVQRIQGAVDKLQSLVGIPALKQIKDKLAKLWEDFKSGVLQKEIVHWAFGAADIETRLETVVKLSVARAKLQKGLEDLYALRSKFKGYMDWIFWVLLGIGGAANLVKWLGVTIPHLLLIIAIAYTTAVGVIVLLGREYTGSQRLLHWVEGVSGVIDYVCAPAV